MGQPSLQQMPTSDLKRNRRPETSDEEEDDDSDDSQRSEEDADKEPMRMPKAQVLLEDINDVNHKVGEDEEEKLHAPSSA